MNLLLLLVIVIVLFGGLGGGYYGYRGGYYGGGGFGGIGLIVVILLLVLLFGGGADILMTEAPAELWLVQTAHDKPRWIVPNGRMTPAPDAVRYVRADLYEALQVRLAVVRSWGDAPCLEPLKATVEAD